MSNIYKIIALTVVFFVCINSACAWDFWSCFSCCSSDTGVDDHDLVDEEIDQPLDEAAFNEYVQLPHIYWFGVR